LINFLEFLSGKQLPDDLVVRFFEHKPGQKVREVPWLR
jgi:hypothetical protein